MNHPAEPNLSAACSGPRRSQSAAVVLVLLMSCALSHAQLAITEVMSSSANTFGSNPITAGPDYWELTNFGTEELDLTGYRFNDNQGGLNQADPNPFADLVVRGHESIVFFESLAGSISADTFRARWGLSAAVRVIAYTNAGYGLSGDGDGVRLWGREAFYDEDVVDSVDFGLAQRGCSFTYDAQTGEFGVLSSIGTGGAFHAATSDDIGSPGTAPGPAGLSVVEQPVSVLANPDAAVRFKIRYRGLPRPSFQWHHNDVPIPGAVLPAYQLAGVQAKDAGRYHVVLHNSFQVVTSATATLVISMTPMAPQFTQAPTDLWVFIDQEAQFVSVATGLPQPTYQWQCNGTNIPGATDNTLVLAPPQPVGTNRYAVIARNTMGAVTNEARLVVTARPDLRITELMCCEAPSMSSHADWWELTNFDAVPVDLFGYRFDDFSDVTGLNQAPRLPFAWVIDDHVILQPGESMVFVESISAERFRRWWGATNLPPSLQIVSYSGANLGLSDTRGDGLGLWNMGAKEDDDFVNGNFTAIVYSQFSITIGASFIIDPEIPDDVCCFLTSVAGVHGAWVAPEAGDIGSPGYIRAPTDPRVFSITRQSNGYRLTWRSVLPGNYVVQYRDELMAGSWRTLATVPPAGPATSFVDTNPSGARQRFYRVMRTP